MKKLVKFTSKANLQTENESQSKDKLACSQAEHLQIRQESCDKMKRLAATLSVSFPLHLQEVWACWCELLSYLEQESKFLDQLEQKLDEIENLQGGAEELQEALDVSIYSSFFTSPSINTAH